jgi:flagella basal body P-ring formation protein FlgA
MKRALTLGLVLTVVAGAGCLSVDGDRITAKDMAAAAQPFAQLPPDTAISFSPQPGRQRIFTAAELGRIARSHGIAPQAFGEICFVRSEQFLSPARLAPVLRAALPFTDIDLEITDFSRYPLPKGKLEFRLSGLERPPEGKTDAVVLWRGSLHYGTGRTESVWARVKLAEPQRWVETTAALSPRSPIRAGEVALKSGPRFPLGPRPIDSLADVTGRRPVRSLPAGQAIFKYMLVPHFDVEPGDTVVVTVISGAASLHFDARAEGGGSAGDRIALLNPKTGKRFVACITAKGMAIVDANEIPDPNSGRAAYAGAVVRPQ